MNVAYLKVTCGLCFNFFFFSAPDCWCLFTGIVVHRLWSSTFSRKHEARAVAGADAGMACHNLFFIFIFFEQLGWCPPGSWCPKQTAYSAYREQRYWFLSSTISFISHRPDRKGTLASGPQRGRGSSPPLCTPQVLPYWRFYFLCISIKKLYFQMISLLY